VAPSLAWIGVRPADNAADDADGDKDAKAHALSWRGGMGEVKFIMFST
jgi:hypothetical protein